MRDQYKILQEAYEQVGEMTPERAQEVVNSIFQCKELQQALDIFSTCPDLAKLFDTFEGENVGGRTGDNRAWAHVFTAIQKTVLQALRVKGQFSLNAYEFGLNDKIVKRAIERSILFDYNDYSLYLEAFESAFEGAAKYAWVTVNRPGEKRNGLLLNEAKSFWNHWKQTYNTFQEVISNFDAKNVYKGAEDETGWAIGNTVELSEVKKRDPETIPQVLRDIPEIMDDIDGFEKWFFTHTQYASIADQLDDDALMSVYQARIEDYNEGEGLEWGDSEYKVQEDFKKWAKEYLNSKLKSVYKKAAKDTGWDIQNTI